MQWLNSEQRANVGMSAGVFVFGLIAAALSAIAAYANFMFLAQLSDARVMRRSIEVNNNYAPVPKALDDDAEYQKFSAREKSFAREVRDTMYLSLALGVCSYGAFVFGTFEFRQLVLR